MSEHAKPSFTNVFLFPFRDGRRTIAKPPALCNLFFARHYIASNAAVSECLTDQLMLPLTLAGSGAFTTEAVSLHARMIAEVNERFLPVRFEFDERYGINTVFGQNNNGQACDENNRSVAPHRRASTKARIRQGRAAPDCARRCGHAPGWHLRPTTHPAPSASCYQYPSEHRSGAPPLAP